MIFIKIIPQLKIMLHIQPFFIRFSACIILVLNSSLYAEPIIKPSVFAKMQANSEAKKQARIDAECRHWLNITTTAEADQTLPTPQLRKLYTCKITSAWEVPSNSAGQSVKVSIQIDSEGNVLSTEIQSHSKKMQDSIRQAILQSAPYPLPKTMQYREFIYITFTAK